MPKWMKLLAAGVAVLAAVYGLTRLPRSDRPRLPAAPESPVKLRVESPRSRVTLEKAGGAWRVTDPVDWPADEGAVARLLGGLKALAFESEVTSRAESHPQYELEEGKAARVRAWGAGAEEPFDVYLGKNAGFTDRAYARLGDAPAVYLAAGLSRDAVDLSTAAWRERDLLPRDAEVVRVEAVRGRRRFTVEKSSAGWTVDGKPADQSKAGAFVSALRNLSADDLADPPAALGKPEALFMIFFSTGAPVSLSLGLGDPHPVKKQGVETLYLVPAYRASELDKSPEDFLPAGKQGSSPPR